jgi:hypothetical protein
MMNKVFAFILAMACLCMNAQAIERSAALPYDYSNSINKVYVPGCSSNQYVAVSGSQFVCRNFVAASCASGQFVTYDGTAFVCKNVSSTTAAATPQPKCSVNGSYLQVINGNYYCVYTLTTSNRGMGGNCTLLCNGSDEMIGCSATMYPKKRSCYQTVSMSSGDDHSCSISATCRAPATY